MNLERQEKIPQSNSLSTVLDAFIKGKLAAGLNNLTTSTHDDGIATEVMFRNFQQNTYLTIQCLNSQLETDTTTLIRVDITHPVEGSLRTKSYMFMEAGCFEFRVTDDDLQKRLVLADEEAQVINEIITADSQDYSF